jgi:hypothetical protein
MRILLRLFFVVLCISIISGCTQEKAVPVTEPETSKPTHHDEGQVPHEIPDGILTPALEAIGAPFTHEIEYRAKGLPGASEATGSRTVNTTVLEDGNLRITIGWSGELSSALPNQEFEARKDGIRSISLSGERIEPSAVALPADMKIGTKWTSKFSFTRSADQAKVTMEATSEITKVEGIPITGADKMKTNIIVEAVKVSEKKS